MKHSLFSMIGGLALFGLVGCESTGGNWGLGVLGEAGGYE